jgi:hypothetical protein
LRLALYLLTKIFLSLISNTVSTYAKMWDNFA